MLNANAGTPIFTNEANTLEPVQAFVELDLGWALGTGNGGTLQLRRAMLNQGSRACRSCPPRAAKPA